MFARRQLPIEGEHALGLQAGERSFRLGDIAEVRRGTVEPATTQMRFDGQAAVGLAVSMRKGGDVIRLGEQLTATVARVQARLPVGVQVHAVSDQPAVVDPHRAGVEPRRRRLGGKAGPCRRQ